MIAQGSPSIASRAGLVIAVAAFVLVTGLSRGTAEQITDANAFEKSATASTAADHEALAAYFRTKAENAGKEADAHKRMLTAAMNGKNYSAMLPHCRSLIRASREAQESYEDLAELHARMAKEGAK